jgi:CheY-like chemotaxis protein
MELKDATILVVDDEVALLEILAGWFERQGCRVLTAKNGADALKLAEENQVDAVVSDIRMPVLDGIGLVQRLKEKGEYIPKIIFISGFTDTDDRDCFDLGVEAILAKPIKRPALIDAVRRSLMDRDTLWKEPSALAPTKELNDVFPSLSIARERGLIVFGRGGFCIRSSIPMSAGDPIALRLVFEADHLALVGHGIARWTDHSNEQIGIEIIHVEGDDCAWFAEAAKSNGSMSFIPRDSPVQVPS